MSKPSFMSLAAVLAPAIVFTAVLANRSATPTGPEVARLRRHFATVEQELLARDVSHLTSAQRAARTHHIERLRTYRAAGVFPKNTDHPGQRVPYFVDRFGTRCAMAYLIEQSGSGDYVRRVSEKMNNARIGEIARDPELGATLFAWLEENGLTVEEAARIQPEYGCRRNCVVNGGSNRDYAPHTLVALALGGGSLISNATGAQRPAWVGGLGVVSGVLGIAAGSMMLGDMSASEPLALSGIGVGVLSTYFGLRTLLSSTPQVEATASARVNPWLPHEGGAGVVLNVSF